jgi:rhomboid protease GluP
MICPECHGSGKCGLCNAEGYAQCSHCGGRGSLPAALPTDEKLDRPCVFCHGTGSVECNPVCEVCRGYGEIDDEDASRQEGTGRREFREYGDYAGWKILLACIILFVGGAISTQLVGRDVFLYLFALNGERVMAGEWWRMVTCMFVHIGFVHFFLNAYALCMLSPPLEKLLGRNRFLALYFLSGMIGSVLTIMLKPAVWSAGASGAIYGLVGAYLGLHFRYKPFYASLMSQILLFLLADLIIAFIPGMRINTLAHYGGLLGGIGLSYLVRLEKTEI